MTYAGPTKPPRRDEIENPLLPFVLIAVVAAGVWALRRFIGRSDELA